MIELNTIVHGFVIAQIVMMAICAIKADGRGFSQKCLIILAILILMFTLKPLFLLYKLNFLYYTSVFTSGFLPYMVYLFSSGLLMMISFSVSSIRYC